MSARRVAHDRDLYERHVDVKAGRRRVRRGVDELRQLGKTMPARDVPARADVDQRPVHELRRLGELRRAEGLEVEPSSERIGRVRSHCTEFQPLVYELVTGSTASGLQPLDEPGERERIAVAHAAVAAVDELEVQRPRAARCEQRVASGAPRSRKYSSRRPASSHTPRHDRTASSKSAASRTGSCSSQRSNTGSTRPIGVERQRPVAERARSRRQLDEQRVAVRLEARRTTPRTRRASRRTARAARARRAGTRARASPRTARPARARRPRGRDPAAPSR